MLHRPDLEDYIKEVVKKSKSKVSLKMRANVEGVNNLAIAQLAEKSGVDYLHIDAMKKGGNLPCILNAANEVVVKAFLEERISFLQMSELIEFAMRKVEFIAQPTYEDYVETDKKTRIFVSELF